MSTTAVDLLQQSKLVTNPRQLELLGGDTDLSAFFIEMRDKAGINLVSAITSADVSRTITGASTLTVVVEDDNVRSIQRSGRLGRKVDVKVDGLWWTLVSVKKNGRQLTLTFEEREVNVCRYYNKFKYASRDKTTRAHFIYSMLQEVKEIHFVIGKNVIAPELDVKQPISDIGPNEFLIGQNGQPLVVSTDQATLDMHRAQGIHYGTALTVKGAPATIEQIDNANIILETARRMGASAKVQIAAITTGITESALTNLEGGDADSVGVFQQRPSQGWPATRVVATDAAAFIQRAMEFDSRFPNVSVALLCQNVQHSAFSDGSNYAQWVDEGEAFVKTYGTQVPASVEQALTQAKADAASIAAGNPTTTQGQYYVRGTITKKNSYTILKKEDTWTCGQRLTADVNWRFFCVSGVMYIISDYWLFKSKPFMRISEDTEGIDTIDYDYDEGKRTATVTITAHLSRWSAPPGSTIEIFDQNIPDGKWLVETVDRSLFDAKGTITAIKPEPKLPEPTTLTQLPTGAPNSASSVAGNTSPGGQVEIPTQGLTITQITVLKYATAQIGEPYVWGADNPAVGFDCSGLTEAAYGQTGITLPHNAQAQYNKGPIAFGVLQPGDLVFFGASTSSIEHVGIYIGNGAMIDAPHTGATVRVDRGFQDWTDPPFVGATRPWQNPEG